MAGHSTAIKTSTIKAPGTDQPIGCKLIHNDDPDGKGRWFVYLASWPGEWKIPVSRSLWACIQGTTPQTGGVGDTRGVKLLEGSYAHVQLSNDGTATIINTESTTEGIEAAEGMGSVANGDIAYVTNTKETYNA